MHPLVGEAMKKAAVAWLTVGGSQPYPVWCLWFNDALLVVSGPNEQPAPGLDEASAATVTARGDHGGRIVSWRARVERIAPGSEEWDAAVPQLAGKRLNSLATQELGERWARECVLSRLSPTGEPLPLPETSLAVPPLPSPAIRQARPPFRLHRVRRPPADH